MDKEKFRALEQKLDCVPVSNLHTNLRKSVPGMSNNSTHTDADFVCLHGIAWSNLFAHLFCMRKCNRTEKVSLLCACNHTSQAVQASGLYLAGDALSTSKGFILNKNTFKHDSAEQVSA